MIPSLENVISLYGERRYIEALSLLEKLEQEKILHPEVLVWKGRCMQLIDSNPPYELLLIEKAYNQALEIDAGYIPALVELGYFYLNTLDEADRAINYFSRAMALYQGQVTEAVVGMTECLSEVESRDIALDYLANVKNALLDTEKIQKLQKEIESLTQ